jgi:hypothetical protein
MVKVIKLDFKYEQYDVFKVISDEFDLPIKLNNMYILDYECEENGFKIPSAEHINNSISELIVQNNFHRISDFLITELDKDFNKLLKLERDYKLNNLMSEIN